VRVDGALCTAMRAALAEDQGETPPEDHRDITAFIQLKDGRWILCTAISLHMRTSTLKKKWSRAAAEAE